MKKLHVIMLTLLMLLVGVVSISAKERSSLLCLVFLRSMVVKCRVTWLTLRKQGDGKCMVRIFIIYRPCLLPTQQERRQNTKLMMQKELELTKDGKQIKYLSLYACKIFSMPKSLKKTNHKYFWEQTYRGEKELPGTCLLQ